MNVKKMIDEYFKWLKQGYKIEEVDGYSIIHTPFTFSNFDLIDIYVTEKDGNIILSDGGEVLNNLYISGFNLKTRRETMEKFLRVYGLEINSDEEIIKRTSLLKFSQDKHTFIQGILSIDDMFLTVGHRVKSYFLKDVKEFFELNQIYASPNINLRGKSNLEHHFDFLLNKNSKHEERLIKVMNDLNGQGLKSTMYSFKDIQDVNRKTENIIIYNDTKKINQEQIEALKFEKIELLSWSEREKWREDFRA